MGLFSKLITWVKDLVGIEDAPTTKPPTVTPDTDAIDWQDVKATPNIDPSIFDKLPPIDDWAGIRIDDLEQEEDGSWTYTLIIEDPDGKTETETKFNSDQLLIKDLADWLVDEAPWVDIEIDIDS